MKIRYSLPLLACAATFTACNKPMTVTDQGARATNAVSGQEVRDKYKDATKATRDYAAQNKDEFVATMNQKLKDLDAKFDELTTKSQPYQDEAKAQANKALDSLREERKVVAEKLEKAKDASADVWQQMKDGVSSAMDDLEKAYDRAKAKFN